MTEDEAMTLIQLIEKAKEAAPSMDAKVGEILRSHPELWKFERDAQGRETVASYMLGRIVAIALLDFLAWSFGKPHLGWVPKDRGPELL